MFNKLVQQNMALSVKLLGGEGFYLPAQKRTIQALFDNPLVQDMSTGSERLVERPMLECSESDLIFINKRDVIVRLSTGIEYSVVDFERDKTNGITVYLVL